MSTRAVSVVALALAAGIAVGAPRGPRPAAFQVREIQADSLYIRYLAWLPPGFDPARTWPAIVFLHGSGESGADPEAPARVGLGPALRAHPERWPFVVLFPQKPSEEEEWEEREARVLAVADDAIAHLAVDPDRVALSGISQGGHGVWYVAARHPGRWSALVPVCGYGRARTVAGRIGAVSVWAFHGVLDDLVLPYDTRAIIDDIRARRRRAGDHDTTRARLTLYPDANHNSWDPAYAEAALPDWLLEQRRPPR